MYDSTYNIDSDDNYNVVITSTRAKESEPLNAKIQFSKSSPPRRVRSRKVNTRDQKDLKTLSNQRIKFTRYFKRDVTYNDWTYDNAHLTVPEDNLKNIAEGDLIDKLAIVQQLATNKMIFVIIIHAKLNKQSRVNQLIKATDC